MVRLGFWPLLYFIVHRKGGNKRQCHQTDESRKFKTKIKKNDFYLELRENKC